MKKIVSIFIAVLFYLPASAQEVQPAISRFSVMVDGDVINAFAPLPDSAATDAEVGQYFKDQATSMKTGYKTYEAYLTHYCYDYLNEHLKADFGISFGPKVPKDGMFSYTPYDYPQMGLKKAAKSGTANSYIHIEIKFGYKESFINSGKSSSETLTPVVDVAISLADNTGKTTKKGDGKATSSKTFTATRENIQVWSKTTSGTTFRADVASRKALLKDLFAEAYSNFKKDFK